MIKIDYFFIDKNTRIQLIAGLLKQEIDNGKEKIILKEWCKEKGFLYNECKEAAKQGEYQGYFETYYNNKGYVIKQKTDLNTIVKQILKEVLEK